MQLYCDLVKLEGEKVSSLYQFITVVLLSLLKVFVDNVTLFSSLTNGLYLPKVVGKKVYSRNVL